ncbi:MAG: IPT/TIG domain-containing protein [Actinobacteria bacterium]|nr:IPT/TIG domain-containing protein [Actinomycetota bacterium]
MLVTANGGATWSAQSLALGGWYVSWDGTSMATPHVAGAIALCAARFPLETVAQRVRRILDHVDPIASLSGKTATGGRLNVANALTPALSIAKLRPAAARRGAVVTITGTGFGTRAALSASFVKFGARVCTAYSSWSATQIKCRVPAQARYGAVKVTVTTAAGTSNAVSFTVKR